MHFRGFWRLEGTPSFVALGRVIICDLNFKRTENHNFTITTNMSQHVEFFHSLIFIIIIGGGFSDISGLLSAMLHRVFYQTPGIHMVMYCFTPAL